MLAACKVSIICKEFLLAIKQHVNADYEGMGVNTGFSLHQCFNGIEVEQTREGLAATTLVRCLQQTQSHSLLLAKPITGRTHQIRVHLSWLGHAIVGDHLYGKPDAPEQSAARLMLHCHRIAVPGYGSFSAAGADFDLGSL